MLHMFLCCVVITAVTKVAYKSYRYAFLTSLFCISHQELHGSGEGILYAVHDNTLEVMFGPDWFQPSCSDLFL